ncbi:hypothetical protein ACMFMG_005212 [Clarireedia jacksonii]
MQFQLFVLVSLAAIVYAQPLLPRQDTAPAVDASQPSMSNANGDVVTFDSTGVYQAATNAGL